MTKEIKKQLWQAVNDDDTAKAEEILNANPWLSRRNLDFNSEGEDVARTLSQKIVFSENAVFDIHNSNDHQSLSPIFVAAKKGNLALYGRLLNRQSDTSAFFVDCHILDMQHFHLLITCIAIGGNGELLNFLPHSIFKLNYYLTTSINSSLKKNKHLNYFIAILGFYGNEGLFFKCLENAITDNVIHEYNYNDSLRNSVLTSLVRGNRFTILDQLLDSTSLKSPDPGMMQAAFAFASKEFTDEVIKKRPALLKYFPNQVIYGLITSFLCNAIQEIPDTMTKDDYIKLLFTDVKLPTEKSSNSDSIEITIQLLKLLLKKANLPYFYMFSAYLVEEKSTFIQSIPSSALIPFFEALINEYTSPGSNEKLTDSLSSIFKQLDLLGMDLYSSLDSVYEWFVDNHKKLLCCFPSQLIPYYNFLCNNIFNKTISEYQLIRRCLYGLIDTSMLSCNIIRTHTNTNTTMSAQEFLFNELDNIRGLSTHFKQPLPNLEKLMQRRLETHPEELSARAITKDEKNILASVMSNLVTVVDKILILTNKRTAEEQTRTFSLIDSTPSTDLTKAQLVKKVEALEKRLAGMETSVYCRENYTGKRTASAANLTDEETKRRTKLIQYAAAQQATITHPSTLFTSGILTTAPYTPSTSTPYGSSTPAPYDPSAVVPASKTFRPTSGN